MINLTKPIMLMELQGDYAKPKTKREDQAGPI